MNKRLTMAALLLCGVLILGGCGNKASNQAASGQEISQTVEEGTAVETAVIEKANIQNEYKYSGKIQAINEINVLSTVSGTVKAVNYDVGDKVSAGATLFAMDTEDIINTMNVAKASLAAAEANIASAQTNLELANGASMQAQIESAKAALSNAELALTDANAKYERNKALYEAQFLSQTEFDNYQRALDQAKISYDQAKKNYDITVNKMPAENIKRAQDNLNTAKASKASTLAQIATYEKSLKDATVTSPISGVVTACNVKAGTVLSQSAGAPFTIIQMDKVNIEVGVLEGTINSLKVGDKVNVKVASVSEDMITGKISTINPAASQDGTYKIKIEINNDLGILKPGMFGEVYFMREKSEDTIVLAREVIVSKNNENYVFIEENGIAKKVVVELGIDNGDQIEIKNGLKEGMHVITKGQTYVADGEKVQVVTGAKGE